MSNLTFGRRATGGWGRKGGFGFVVTLALGVSPLSRAPACLATEQA